jgi:hypothetical protein
MLMYIAVLVLVSFTENQRNLAALAECGFLRTFNVRRMLKDCQHP